MNWFLKLQKKNLKKLCQLLNKNSSIKTKMLLQIHDELVFETPENEFEEILPVIKRNMSDVSSNEDYIFSIPLTVDISSGNNWGEVH